MATTKKYDITESTGEAVAAPAEEQSTSVAESATVAKIKSDIQLKQLQHNQKDLAVTYNREPKFSVSLAPFYAPYLGTVARFAVNGISVFVPCNGRIYEIPETFAGEVARKKRAIDDSLRRQKRAGDVSNNGEEYMGQLTL